MEKKPMDKRENETLLRYWKRVTEAKSNKQIDYTEWGDCILGQDNCYTSENLRKAFYVFEKAVNKLSDEELDEIKENNSEVYEDIKKAKRELEILKIQYQDQRKEYRKYVVTDARFQHLVDVCKSEIAKLPLLPVHKGVELVPEGNVVASSILSDWHTGALYKNSFDEFNKEILQTCVEKLKQKVIKYCKLHSVSELNVNIAGDMINGLIHVSTRVESEEDAISQVVTVSEILARYINDLAKEIPLINVYCVVGNHGRCTPNKSESVSKENFERIIPIMLNDRIKSKNVTITSMEDGDNLLYTINDMKVGLTHGHCDSMQNVINNFVRTYHEVPDVVYMGHGHEFKDINDCGVQVVMNGGLLGADNYAVSIRKVSKRMQTLLVYTSDDVVTYRLYL